LERCWPERLWVCDTGGFDVGTLDCGRALIGWPVADGRRPLGAQLVTGAGRGLPDGGVRGSDAG
jgi:hypothetical protein